MVNLLLMNAVAAAVKDVAATSTSTSPSATVPATAAKQSNSNLSGTFLLSGLAQDQPSDFGEFNDSHTYTHMRMTQKHFAPLNLIHLHVLTLYLSPVCDLYHTSMNSS
jgi:hypothetical protein